MNNKILFLSALFFFFCLITTSFPRGIDSTKSSTTITRMRLPRLPSKDKKSSYYSLEDEVATLLSETIRELRLYDVIVGIEMDSSFEPEVNEKEIIDFTHPSRFIEAIVISAVELSQQAVSPQRENDYFQLDGTVRDLFDRDENGRDIHTELILTARIVDIETQQVVAPFEIEAMHTGGSRQKSRSKAMDQLKKKMIRELKWYYWLAAEISGRQDGIRELPIGTDMRIRKNELFEIIEPDRTMEIGQQDELVILGGAVALATVVDTAKKRSHLKILRQWRDDYPGSWAVEHPKKVYALQFTYFPPMLDSNTSYAIQYNASPLRACDWGFGVQIIKVVDSFDDNDYGFGFNGFGLYRFLNMSKLDLGAKVAADLDIPFRKDDADQTVSTALLSAHIGVVAEFLISAKFDLVLMAGYRFGVKSESWSYSEDEESYDAYWEEVAPEVDNSGFTISVGTRFLLNLNY